MYQLASAGGVGINFHGGGYGVYTPIAGTVASGFTARPISMACCCSRKRERDT